MNSSPLLLDQITVVGVPSFEPVGGCRLFFKVYQGSVAVYTSSIYQVTDKARHFTMCVGDNNNNHSGGGAGKMPGQSSVQLRGDILIKCYHRYCKPLEGREAVFSVQFHTCAVANHMLVFQRQDLDDACRGELIVYSFYSAGSQLENSSYALQKNRTENIADIMKIPKFPKTNF